MRASCFDLVLAIFSSFLKGYRLPVTQLFVHPPQVSNNSKAVSLYR
jgi:hypothetical protein